MRHRPAPFTTFEPEPSIHRSQRVGRIPFTLMRNSLVTRDPEQMEHALEAYEDEVPPVSAVFPQRVQWQQWKSDTYDVMYSGANRARYAQPQRSVAPVLAALAPIRPSSLTQDPSFVRRLHQQAAMLSTQDDGEWFPSAPADYSPMLMRDQPAYGRPVSLPGLTEDDDYEPMTHLPPHVEGQGIQRALQVHRTNQGTVISYMLMAVEDR